MNRSMTAMAFAFVVALCALAASPARSEEATSLTSAEIAAQLIGANRGWLEHSAQEISYTFSMQHVGKSDFREWRIDYKSPDRLQVLVKDEVQERKLTNNYDPNNSAFAPKLITILQGMTFFGPMQELKLHPDAFRFAEAGGETIHGREARVYEIQPAAGEKIPLRIGCGIWGMFYGYAGRGFERALLWIDAGSGVVLREEGYFEGEHTPAYRAEYSQHELTVGGGLAPRQVLVTIFDERDGKHSVWAFDMKFSVHDGHAWILDELTQSRDGVQRVAAVVSNVVVRP